MGSVPGTCKCQDLYPVNFFSSLDFKLRLRERSSELFLIGTVVLRLANTCICSVFTEENTPMKYSFCVGDGAEREELKMSEDLTAFLDCIPHGS